MFWWYWLGSNQPTPSYEPGAWTNSATVPILEVGAWIEHATLQCYGFAIQPLTIRATDQFYFQWGNQGIEPCLLPDSSYLMCRHLVYRTIIAPMKIEFVYLSDFSACASITEAAHLSLFIVVTRSLVPHIHFSPIKKPPSIATGGLLKTFDVSYIIRHNPPSSQNDTRGIL